MVGRVIFFAVMTLFASAASAAECNWTKAKIDIDWTLFQDGGAKNCVLQKMKIDKINAVSAISQCNSAMDHQNFRRCIASGHVCRYLVEDQVKENKPPWTPCK